MKPYEVDQRARTFADELSALLNTTITTGIRLTAVTSEPRGSVVVIGDNITPQQQDATVGIPLTLGRTKARLFLGLSYRLAADDFGAYLMVVSSFVGLFADAALEQALLHYDYERDKGDGYPAAHLQIEASSEQWERALPAGRALFKLHLPTGGRRYRPTLEDLIEFLVTETLVSAHRDWRRHVEEGREGFHRRQMRAAIRNSPNEALDVPRELGHLPRS